RDRGGPADGAAGGWRGLGDLRTGTAGGSDGEGGDQPATLCVAAGATAGEEDADRADRAAAARERARDDQARRPPGAPAARRDPRRRRRRGATRRPAPPRPRPPRLVILCLVDDDPASLEALTFASRLGDVEALV